MPTVRLPLRRLRLCLHRLAARNSFQHPAVCLID
jgi:hypothetical protein